GQLRALAVTSAERNALLPDVPTFAEAGVSGMNLENWTGLVVPAGTPPAIIDKISTEAIKAVNLPDVRKRLLAMGFVPTGLGPAAFGEVIHKDVARWAEIIKLRHITAG
ncbi:MAG: tripartite tricarboxylate transporter substrate-binding protein, partial [Rhodoferax sp.]